MIVLAALWQKLSPGASVFLSNCTAQREAAESSWEEAGGGKESDFHDLEFYASPRSCIRCFLFLWESLFEVVFHYVALTGLELAV